VHDHGYPVPLRHGTVTSFRRQEEGARGRGDDFLPRFFSILQTKIRFLRWGWGFQSSRTNNGIKYTFIDDNGFSNEQLFSVDSESSLQGISSHLSLWKRNGLSGNGNVILTHGKPAASTRACLREANAER